MEAAVGEALPTRLVLLVSTRMEPSPTPNSVAATCATLVFTSWPISTPPWETETVPSL